MFKSDFKYYKSKRPPPDFSNVIDFNNFNDTTNDKVTRRKVSSQQNQLFTSKDESKFGLKATNEWKIFELVDKPGLIVIVNPFTSTGQRYWTCKCLQHFTKKPHKLNIDKHENEMNGTDWWDHSVGNKALQSKLRWATLGYHHNWDTKVYSENDRSPFPSDLENLTNFIARVLGFTEFKAEAAIINYYNMNSTLSGHTDFSEVNREAPLISISFGQSAVFLIGGLTREEKPTALYIHSGDVVIMSGESRLHVHGVPKILPAPARPWVLEPDLGSESGCTCNDDCTSSDCEVPTKKFKACFESYNGFDEVLWLRCKEGKFWEPFEHYFSTSRINMNVRQVLLPGQTKLNV